MHLQGLQFPFRKSLNAIDVESGCGQCLGHRKEGRCWKVFSNQSHHKARSLFGEMTAWKLLRRKKLEVDFKSLLGGGIEQVFEHAFFVVVRELKQYRQGQKLLNNSLAQIENPHPVRCQDLHHRRGDAGLVGARDC